MEFQFLPAVIAGIIGGAVMTVVMSVAKGMGMTEMDMSLVEGAFFTDDPQKAKTLGLMMHLVVMSGLVIGSIYALLFAAFGVTGGNAWWVGALFGIVHGLIGGAMMALLPAMHPRMGGGGMTPAAAMGSQSISLREPGLFATNYGTKTPTGIMASHVAYGLVVGLVYGLLV